MDDIRVLFTGAGSPGARHTIKCFRIGAREEGRKISILAADMDKVAYGFYLSDKNLIIPRGDSPEFIPKLLEICRNERPTHLYSGVDPELLPLSRAKKEFEEIGTRVVLSDPEGVEISTQKAKTYEFFREEPFVPDFRIVKNVAEFEDAVKELGYPEKTVCFKPSFSYGMRGFRILKPGINRADILFNFKPDNIFANYDEIIEILREAKSIPQMLVMEYVEGSEYTIDMLLKDKRPVITIPRLRARTKQGISTIAKLEKRDDLIKASESIAQRLGLNYNINMQFKYTEDGIPKLIEIQPRGAGTSIASIAAGANLPYLALKIAMGENIPKINVKWDTQMYRFWEEIFISEGKKSFYGIEDKF